MFENYNKNMFDKINKNRDLIIDSFVKYYGDEYRKIIEDKFDSIIIHFFIKDDIGSTSNTLCANILNKKIKYTSSILKLLGINVSNIKYKKIINKCDNTINIGIYVDDIELNRKLHMLFGYTRLVNGECNLCNFMDYEYNKKILFLRKFFRKKNICDYEIELFNKASCYLKTLKSIINKIQIDEKYTYNFICVCDYINYVLKKDNIDICNKVIGDNNKGIYFSLDDINSIIDKFRNPCCAYANTNGGDIFNIVLLPILSTTDEMFFHELNHQIVTSHLAYIPYGDNLSLVHKSGIDNSMFRIISFEELLNQKTAKIICNYFHESGGNIFEYENKYFNIVCAYDTFFPLINCFFDNFENELKMVRISENHNMLFKYVDKNIFYEYRDYVNDIVSKNLYATDLNYFSDNDYNKCLKFVKKMDLTSRIK